VERATRTIPVGGGANDRLALPVPPPGHPLRAARRQPPGAPGFRVRAHLLPNAPMTGSVRRSYVEIGVRSFGRGIFHKAPVTGASLGNKRVLEIRPGDLVFNNVFAWEGAVALAGPAEAGTIG